MDQPSPPRPRSSGVLLHPTALPGSPVCGSFGEPSRRWLQLLADHDIGVWQMLPLAPPDPTGSPYSSPSCFALNPWCLDAEDLAAEGFISGDQLAALPGADAPRTDVGALSFDLARARSAALSEALLQSWAQQDETRQQAFEEWCGQQRWLEDHVRYRVLHDQHQQPWWNWPRPLAQHQSKALEDWAAEHQDALQRERRAIGQYNRFCRTYHPPSYGTGCDQPGWKIAA